MLKIKGSDACEAMILSASENGRANVFVKNAYGFRLGGSHFIDILDAEIYPITADIFINHQEGEFYAFDLIPLRNAKKNKSYSYGELAELAESEQRRTQEKQEAYAKDVLAEEIRRTLNQGWYI